MSGGLQMFEGLGKHCRGQVAKAWMAPLAGVKNLDIFLDRCLGMGTRFVVLMMCQLILEAAPCQQPYWQGASGSRLSPSDQSITNPIE